MTIKHLPLLIFLLAIAACADMSDTTGPQASSGSGPDWLAMTGHVNMTTPPGENVSQLSQDEGLDQNVQAIELTGRAVGTTYDWEEAVENVTALLASNEAATNPKIERLAPVALLRTHLLVTEEEGAVPHVRAFTERLVRDRSAEVETITAGIERSRSSLTTDEARALAEDALEVAEAWDTDRGDAPPVGELQAVRAAERDDLREARARLRSLAVR